MLEKTKKQKQKKKVTLHDGPRAKFLVYSEQKIWSANWIWLTIYIFIKVGAISINQHHACRTAIAGILFNKGE